MSHLSLPQSIRARSVISQFVSHTVMKERMVFLLLSAAGDTSLDSLIIKKRALYRKLQRARLVKILHDREDHAIEEGNV